MNQVSSRNRSGRWFYDRNHIENLTPSRKAGIDAFDELRYRQTAASFIQECGKSLQLTQLCINTAIVFMHRFFMMHSFKRFDKFDIAASSLFLAAKVEETPRKINHVIEVRDKITNKGQRIPKPDTNSDEYKKRVELLVEHELIMLQTFGFDISIDHPHTHVIRATQFIRAPRELSQVAYFMATNSLYLTTFCLEMRSEIVAATCIYLAFAWSEFEVGLSSDGRRWWSYLDKDLTEETLKENVRTYIRILEEHPTRLREMKQQCDSQNANPRSDSKSRDPMKSGGGVAKIESESRSSSYGSGVKRSGSETNRNDHDTNHPPESKRIKTEQPKPDVKSEFTDDKKPNPVLPPILPPGQKKGPVQNIQNREKDHRRSAPANMNRESHSRLNAQDIIANRKDGESIMHILSSDLNLLKQCLKSKELWQQLSDEEKAYCYKTKAKMKATKKLQEEQRRKGSSRDAIRGPPPPSETKAATDSLLDEF